MASLRTLYLITRSDFEYGFLLSKVFLANACSLECLFDAFGGSLLRIPFFVGCRIVVMVKNAPRLWFEQARPLWRRSVERWLSVRRAAMTIGALIITYTILGFLIVYNKYIYVCIYIYILRYTPPPRPQILL